MIEQGTSNGLSEEINEGSESFQGIIEGSRPSQEINRQMNSRLDEMSKRIDRLQAAIDAPKPKKVWYQPRTPDELITFIGIPAALVVALWGFDDGVWLKLQRPDAATLAVRLGRALPDPAARARGAAPALSRVTFCGSRSAGHVLRVRCSLFLSS